MDLKRTAREVLENVGGEENIISIMSCFTRVRVELKDKTKVDEKKLKEADGCQGVNWVGNTVQIIFGGRCNDVYDELRTGGCGKTEKKLSVCRYYFRNA